MALDEQTEDQTQNDLSLLTADVLEAQVTLLREFNPAFHLSRAASLRRMGKDEDANFEILLVRNDLKNMLECLGC